MDRPVRTWTAAVARAWRDGGTALVTHEGRWSGHEMLAFSRSAADWLATLDLPEGVPVPALFGETGLPALALTLAGSAAGHPSAPLAARLTARELAPAVAALKSPVVLAEPAAKDLAAEVAAAAGVRSVVVPNFAESGRDLPAPEPSAIAAYLHTSGTTGAPKPVPLRQDRLLTRSRVNAGVLELSGDSVYATASPWHHIAGMGNVVVAMAAGAAVVAVERFSVQAWTEASELRPTHALVVPSMLEVLLDARALRPGTVRVVQYGGAPIHSDTLRRVLEALPDVALVQMFGQTEGSPITVLGPEDHRAARHGADRLLNSVGRAAPGVRLRIDDPDGDGTGEVLARGEHLMRPDVDGWLRTGDLGSLDEDGFLYLRGRKHDKIVRGGENVYPQEVEDVLARHPGVAEVGVVGVPDRRLGETVAACVVARDPAAPPSEEDLRAYARERLAGFKVPTSWRFVKALPKTSSGKVRRVALRKCLL